MEGNNIRVLKTARLSEAFQEVRHDAAVIPGDIRSNNFNRRIDFPALLECDFQVFHILFRRGGQICLVQDLPAVDSSLEVADRFRHIAPPVSKIGKNRDDSGDFRFFQTPSPFDHPSREIALKEIVSENAQYEIFLFQHFVDDPVRHPEIKFSILRLNGIPAECAQCSIPDAMETDSAIADQPLILCKVRLFQMKQQPASVDVGILKSEPFLAPEQEIPFRLHLSRDILSGHGIEIRPDPFRFSSETRLSAQGIDSILLLIHRQRFADDLSGGDRQFQALFPQFSSPVIVILAQTDFRLSVLFSVIDRAQDTGERTIPVNAAVLRGIQRKFHRTFRCERRHCFSGRNHERVQPDCRIAILSPQKIRQIPMEILFRRE